MPERINWKMDIQVSGGPKISASQSIAIEAYDSIKVTVLGTAQGTADSDKELEVQPGSSGQVSFLAITSDRYFNDTADDGSLIALTYKVNGNENPVIILDRPHILAGQGAVGLLNPDHDDETFAPTSLFFSSTIAENAEIHILVGRDATP